MKKFPLFIVLVWCCLLVDAQDQFTNSGNFQTFASASVTFFGNFSNNGTFADAALAVTFSGTVSQTISGTSATTFYNLVENNATNVTLQQDIAISNSLALTSGQLDLNSHTLTISNTASTAVSRISGYILSERVNNSSKIKWNIGSDLAPHVFPFGTATAVYVPFTMEVTAGDIGNVAVSTYPTAADNTPYPTSPASVTNVNRFGIDNSANVVDRFWQIDKDGPSGTATLTFTAAAAEVGTISTLNAQRWNPSTNVWEDPLAGQSSGATTATVFGVTAFSPWTLSGNNAPLPIEIINFTATAMEGEVDLDWKTASEVNNDYFTLQRSNDGLGFSDIAKVPANTSNKIIQKYNYVDRNPFPGRSYYRLKQTDLDGAYTYSAIRKVEIEKSMAKITAFPNPATNNEFSLDFQNSLESPTSIIVYDLLGRIIFNQVVHQGVRIYTIYLSNDSPTGEYIVKAVNTGFTFQQTVILE